MNVPKDNNSICVIAYSFYEVDFRVRRYAEALVEAGFRVDVLALRRREQSKTETLNGVYVYRLQERAFDEKRPSSFLAKMTMFWVRVLLFVSSKAFTTPYRMIHVNNPPDFLVFSCILSKLRGTKIIFDMHENLPEFFCAKFARKEDSFPAKILKYLEKAAVKWADFTIVAHDLLRIRVLGRDGIPEKKCLALLNYPKMGLFQPAARKMRNQVFRVIYPGTVSYVHGVDIAIKAMHTVKKECNDIRLDIYMAGNRDYYHELLDLVEQLGLNDIVTFHNAVPIDKMRDIMAEADLGVVPKRGGVFGSEAFSTKILEFMAAEVPVVVSRTKIDEFYFDASMVRFFEQENDVDLARCIVELYRDDQKRLDLVMNAKRFISNHNWETKKDIYLDAVKQLIQ